MIRSLIPQYGLLSLRMPRIRGGKVRFQTILRCRRYSGDISGATGGYRRLREEEPDSPGLAESRLNALGYRLLRAEKLDEAVALFRLNVEFYPEAYNTYDSLGEAYMVRGEAELAITNYENSLELNPDNANAEEMLKNLKGE